MRSLLCSIALMRFLHWNWKSETSVRYMNRHTCGNGENAFNWHAQAKRKYYILVSLPMPWRDHFGNILCILSFRVSANSCGWPSIRKCSNPIHLSLWKHIASLDSADMGMIKRNLFELSCCWLTDWICLLLLQFRLPVTSLNFLIFSYSLGTQKLQLPI